MLNSLGTGGGRTKDKIAIVIVLLALVCVSWIYLFYISNNMPNMSMSSDMRDNSMGMAAMKPNMPMPWGINEWLTMFIMWSIMMIGMMIPSASPMILVFDRIKRQNSNSGDSYLSTGIFVLGYVIIWTLFSVLATATNYVLHSNSLMSGMMGESTNNVLGGILLIATGIFQFTPIKRACLTKCRTPMGFLMTNWKDGTRGALRMGIEHGTYCLVCCWLLMGLLFVLGVMNLVWIAVLSLFVLIEKMAPKAEWISWSSGVGMIIWGACILLI